MGASPLRAGAWASIERVRAFIFIFAQIWCGERENWWKDDSEVSDFLTFSKKIFNTLRINGGLCYYTRYSNTSCRVASSICVRQLAISVQLLGE
jgi:hypothetical protein